MGCYRNNCDICEAERSDNFIIGLTNVSPTVTAPTVGSYAVCGQYPGVVGVGTTVNLQCTHDMPGYRYVIVQFPSSPDGMANFCELEVYIRRKFLCSHSVITWQTDATEN